MTASPAPASDSRKCDFGYFHLTSKGWTRCDEPPFPGDRIETWQYEEERPADGVKDRIRLTRIWCAAGIPEAQLTALHARFGEAVVPDPDRHIILDCIG